MQINIPTENFTRTGKRLAVRIRKIGKLPKWIWYVILGVLIAGITVWIILSWPEPPKPDYPIVEVQPVVIDDVEIYGEYAGKISAQQFVEIRARVEGYLEEMLFEEGIVLLRREFDQGSHLTVYNSGYVLFSAGKRNTVFHIHDCCGDYAYDAAEGKGDVIEEEYFENCEWHIRALFEGERKMEDNQAKCEDAGRSNVCVSYHALSEDWSEVADRTINMLEKIIENEAVHAMLAVLTDKQRDLIHQQFVLGKTHQEIADDMGISRGSVTRAVNQALERIRRKFDFEAHYELAAGGLA